MKDQFGPEYIVKVYDAHIGMEGFLVVDNTVLGPGKGGIRMTANLSEEEVGRLARTMTWKNALAGIPFGGAKAGIIWPGGDAKLKKVFVQSFALAIKPFIPRKYIAGPDVNTGEKEMQWFVETTGNWHSATGKPVNLCMKLFGKAGEKCGIPHEFGSTGFGVAQAVAETAKALNINIRGARVAIHGFGNVGTFIYTYLRNMGAVIVAVADRSGAIFAKEGLDDLEIQKVMKEKQLVSECKQCRKISDKEFWKIPVDFLIPASVTDVINETNKNDIRAKAIIDAGNIPMNEKIEEELFKKGIFILPDFVANAGGVISSYAEYRGYNPKKMFDLVERKIKSSTRIVLEQSIKLKKNPRRVALAIAQEKVEAGMNKRII